MDNYLVSILQEALNWSFLSGFIIPNLLIQISIFVILFGYGLIYVLTRTDYGISAKKKVDMKLETNQDYIIGPLIISSTLITGVFLFSFSFILLLKSLSLILTRLFPNLYSIDASQFFYLFFFSYLAVYTRAYFLDVRKNGLLLRAAWVLLKLLVNFAIALLLIFLIITSFFAIIIEVIPNLWIASFNNTILGIVFLFLIPFFIQELKKILKNIKKIESGN